MVLVCLKVVPPLLYDWISLLLFAPLRSLLDCHENYTLGLSLRSMRTDALTCRLEKANCTTSWECGQITEQFNKAFDSFSQQKKMRAFDSLWESASENEIIIVSKAKEHNLARASKYIYQKEGYNMWEHLQDL